MGWSIPILFLAIIAYTFVLPILLLESQQTINWVLWLGLSAALGIAIALGHPLSILTAFIAAPITTLDPSLQRVGLQVLSQAYIVDQV